MARLRAALSGWWPVALPPALWALQGGVAWGLASLACPARVGGAVALTGGSARIGIAAATAVGLSTAAAALVAATRRPLPATEAAAADPLVDERRRFARWAGGFVAAAFAVAMVLGVLPALLVGVCETIR